jgi:hypothetical protein
MYTVVWTTKLVPYDLFIFIYLGSS